MAQNAFHVELFDEIPGKERRAAGGLRLASERITAGELVRRRVEAEVERFNQAQGVDFFGLVQPTDAELLLNGARLQTPRPLDAASQTAVALAALEQGRILLLFDDRQIEELDEPLILTGENQVTFIRLVPLVGG